MIAISNPPLYSGLFITAWELVIAVGLFGFAWWRRSVTLGAVACLFLLIPGYVLQKYFPFRLSDSPVLGEAAWLGWMRIVAVIWILFFVGGVATLVLVVQRRRL